MSSSISITMQRRMLPALVAALKAEKVAYEKGVQEQLREYDDKIAELTSAMVEEKEQVSTKLLTHGKATKKPIGESDDLVAKVIKAHPEGVGSTEIQKLAGTSAGGTWRALNRLANIHKIENRDRKWFWIAK